MTSERKTTRPIGDAFAGSIDAAQSMTPEQFMTKLKEHSEQQSHHGIGCICMDQFAREFRKMFKIPTSAGVPPERHDEWLRSSEFDVQLRFQHVVGMAIANL